MRGKTLVLDGVALQIDHDKTCLLVAQDGAEFTLVRLPRLLARCGERRVSRFEVLLQLLDLNPPRLRQRLARRQLVIMRALDLCDLLLDGVRPITARVFWTSVIATVSSKSCSVDLRSKVDERCMGGWALACAERVCTRAAMAASGAAAGLRGTGGLTA